MRIHSESHFERHAIGAIWRSYIVALSVEEPYGGHVNADIDGEFRGVISLKCE